jgi:hypothetical protein
VGKILGIHNSLNVGIVNGLAEIIQSSEVHGRDVRFYIVLRRNHEYRHHSCELSDFFQQVESIQFRGKMIDDNEVNATFLNPVQRLIGRTAQSDSVASPTRQSREELSMMIFLTYHQDIFEGLFYSRGLGFGSDLLRFNFQHASILSFSIL